MMKGYLKLMREDVEKEKSLSDPQFRLYYLILRCAGWDYKHTNKFGLCDLRVRDIRNYLPWSIGKASTTLNELINLGMIVRVDRSTFRVRDFEKYVRAAKQNLQSVKQEVRRIETPIDKEGKSDLEKMKQAYANGNNMFSTSNKHPP